jgi:hypothetical protein
MSNGQAAWIADRCRIDDFAEISTLIDTPVDGIFQPKVHLRARRLGEVNLVENTVLFSGVAAAV